MGFIKSALSLPVKGVSKPITSTLTPRTLRTDSKFYVDVVSTLGRKSKAVPYCPACMTAKLGYHEESNTYGCPNCDFEIPEKIDIEDVDKVREYVATHGSEFNNLHESIDFTNTIRLRVFGARIFGFFAVLATIGLFVSIYKFQIFSSVNCILSIGLLLLLAASQGYRAWQSLNNRFYAVDGKKQFHWYVLNNNWFAYPTLATTNLEEIEQVEKE